MKGLFVLLAVLVVGVAASSSIALAGNSSNVTATPASTQTFDGDNTQAQFVRAASGIINETNRVGLHGTTQNPWSPYDVSVQFRPLTGPGGTGSPTPNPACEGPTVVAPFTFVNNSNADAAISGTATNGYFIRSNPYNVCVYYGHPFLLTLRVDALTSLTTTVGHQITYSGGFTNGSVGVNGQPVTLDVFTGTGCNTANTLYTGISAGSTDSSGSYSFLAGPSPLGTYSVIAHSTSPLGTVTSNCTDITVQGQVASGTVDSSSEAGISASLPLAGTYRIDVSGTWDNTSHGLVDAEYDNGDLGHTPADFTAGQDGFSGLGADFGDLLVNGAVVNWGVVQRNSRVQLLALDERKYRSARLRW